MLQKNQEKSWKQDLNKVAKKVGVLGFKKAAKKRINKNKQKNGKKLNRKVKEKIDKKLKISFEKG